MSRVGGCSHSDRAKSRHDLRGPAIKRITTCLWFDTAGEEAAEYYTSVFPDSTINSVSHYGEAGPRPAGSVLTVDFELDGQPFVALNGGPELHLQRGRALPGAVSRRPRSTTTGAGSARAGRKGSAIG